LKLKRDGYSNLISHESSSSQLFISKIWGWDKEDCASDRGFWNKSLTSTCMIRQWSYAFPSHTLEEINFDDAPDEPMRILEQALDLVRGHYINASVIFRFLAKSTTMTGRTVLALLMLFPSLVPRLGKSVVCMEIASPAGSFWKQR
jgi:hypothetical protein